MRRRVRQGEPTRLSFTPFEGVAFLWTDGVHDIASFFCEPREGVRYEVQVAREGILRRWHSSFEEEARRLMLVVAFL
jgi:hypothetical protein